MDRNNDILSSDKLKSFHPGATEGYFQEFRSRAEAIPHSNHVNAAHRAASYAAIAATFILMVVGGTFFLEKVTPDEAVSTEVLSEADYIIYSTILPSISLTFLVLSSTSTMSLPNLVCPTILGF